MAGSFSFVCQKRQPPFYNGDCRFWLLPGKSLIAAGSLIRCRCGKLLGGAAGENTYLG